MHPNIIIDSEFQALLDPLESVERAQLEKNIASDGCRDPLVLWLKPSPKPGEHKCYAYDESKCDLRFGDGVWTCEHCEHNPALLEYVLVDGHNRYEICTRLGIDFDTVEIEFEDRDAAMDWIDANQMGKRNMSPEAFTRAMGRRYNRQKKAVSNASGSNQHKEVSGHFVHQPKTSESLAETYNVNERTVRRAGAYDTAAKVIEAAGGSVFGENQQDVVQAARVVADVPALADDVPLAAQFAKLPQEVQQRAIASVVENSEPAKEVMREAVKAHVAHNSGNNEWYTPSKYIELAREVMGRIDTDPATSEVANRTVQAAQIYTADDDGRTKVWAGRVWMNPPYAQPLMGDFAEAVASKYESGEIEQACILVNNATETQWFQRMLVSATAVCFPKSRIKFIDPDGKASGAPLQGQAILYMGSRVDAFRQAFSAEGRVLSNV